MGKANEDLVKEKDALVLKFAKNEEIVEHNKKKVGILEKKLEENKKVKSYVWYLG